MSLASIARSAGLSMILLSTGSSVGLWPLSVIAGPAVEVPAHDESHADTHDAVEALVSEPGTIEIESASKRQDDPDLTGSLSTPSGEMSFHTRSTRAGKRVPNGAVADRVEAVLEINGAVITHVFDDARGTITIKTDEPVTLAEADVRVLMTFQQAFGKARLSGRNADIMSRPTEVLFRLGEMYSEAPLGAVIAPYRKIRPDSSLYVSQDAPALAAGPNLLAGPDLAKSCANRNGNEFIDLGRQGNVCDKGYLARSEAHDYCMGPGRIYHGYVTSQGIQFGCGSNACKGRCGAGCGALDGVGAWQKDCLDHDRCSLLHGQMFQGCGDEWDEAVDDYLLGVIRCTNNHCN